MIHDASLARIRTIGRAVLWLVLGILLASAIYVAVIALTNWSSIGV